MGRSEETLWYASGPLVSLERYLVGLGVLLGSPERPLDAFRWLPGTSKGSMRALGFHRKGIHALAPLSTALS